ncbi:MAG: TIGR00730 family Rossman fold protein [Alphaproteobacteria bacterium]|nr:MAG: TIGR00730 family Rossman fold protein [Alphaproteobacteria bacterium]
MKDIKSLCVYCGSSGNVDDSFRNAASTMGKTMADAGVQLVYGGGHVGLMGLIADAVMDNGGEAIGIIPEHISSKEVQHKGLTELHVVDTMHTRKQMMVDKSDAFLILPGGIGTLDELCEIMTWRQLGIHDKPIIIANINGYWTPFLDMINHIIKAGFMRDGDEKLMIVVESLDEVMPALKEAPDQKFDPSSKWI